MPKLYLGSCAICVYYIATSPFYIFVGIGHMGILTLLNTSLGIVEEVVTQFCLQESLFVWQNFTTMLCGSDSFTHIGLEDQKDGLVIIKKCTIYNRWLWQTQKLKKKILWKIITLDLMYNVRWFLSMHYYAQWWFYMNNSNQNDK